MERRAGTRSRSTIVPAAMSPNRWSLDETSKEMTPMTRRGGVSSTMPIRPRTRAWRKRIGAPCTVTTRNPSAALPGVLPRHSDSKTIG